MSKFNDDHFYIEGEDNKNNVNFHLAKSDDELFHENDYVVHSIIRVRRVKTAKNEKWQILKDNEIMITLNSTRFSKKEKNFLYTPEGMTFLVSSFKKGLKSVAKIKLALGEILK